MSKIARTLKMGAAACAVAAGTALVTPPAAQASPVTAPPPELLGSLLGISCVVTVGEDCGANGVGTGKVLYLGKRNPNPPDRYDFFVINPTIPLSLIPVLGPPLAGWWASLNFEACVGGLGVRIGPYGTLTKSLGRGC